MQDIKKMLLIFSCLAVIVSFQNCVPSSKVDFKDSASKLANQEPGSTEGGDGQPFDGKVYVLNGDLCPDQTHVQAKILLKTFTSAALVREKCRDISPIALSSNDFQLNPANSEQMSYQSELFTSVKPTQVVGTQINLAAATSDTGFAYLLKGNFGTAPDVTGFPSQSKLRLYEDGVLMGPAHSIHADIRSLGRGRFSHWDDSLGANPGAGESLRISASDNTDPRSNGRIYSYDLGN